MTAPLALAEPSDVVDFDAAFDHCTTVGACAVLLAAACEARNLAAAQQHFALLWLACFAAFVDLEWLDGKPRMGDDDPLFDPSAYHADEEAARRSAAKREARARALWREAQTAELRAHLRLVYPRLFANQPDPRPRRERFPPGPSYPPDFHSWPLKKRNGWFAEFNLDRLRREREAAK